MRKLIISVSVMLAFLTFGGLSMTASAVEYEEAEPIYAEITVEIPQYTDYPQDLDLVPDYNSYIPVPDFPGFVPDFSLNPPSGTGTVVDTSDSSRQTEFFTIMTPEGNTFYLIIDRRHGQENVFFLNAVTEADLFALTGISRPVQPQNPTAPYDGSQPPIVPPNGDYDTSEMLNGNYDRGLTGHIIVLGVAVVLLAVAGWYFKVYKPKQQPKNQPSYDEEYEESDWDNETDE